MKLFEHSNVLDTGEGFIVHQCNAQGEMGSGIAREIRERFPKVYQEYRNQFENGGLKLGTIQVVEIAENKFIVNAIAQEFYGRDSSNRFTSYDALATCFSQVNELVLGYGAVIERILPVRFPAIGAGLGGGKWPIIAAIIENELSPNIPQELHLFP
jgi:O-acetyl-ADP-ribose deacetylase (regulator of RNase III)